MLGWPGGIGAGGIDGTICGIGGGTGGSEALGNSIGGCWAHAEEEIARPSTLARVYRPRRFTNLFMANPPTVASR